MAIILNNQQSTSGSPYAYYTVNAETSNRTATTTNVVITVTSHLGSSGSSLGTGYILTAGILLNGNWLDFQIKSRDDMWSGTTDHVTTNFFTIATDATSSVLTNVQFRVVRSDGLGNSCKLNAVGCSDITLPLQPITPTISLSMNIEDTYTITLYPNYSAFVHVVNMTLGSTTSSVTFPSNQSSVSYTVPSSFYAEIPNASYGIGTISVDTYDSSGNNYIGTSSGGTLTLYANEARCKPTLSNVSLVDTNVDTIALTGDSTKIIPRYSTGRVQATLTALNNATATSLTLQTGSQTIVRTGSQTTLSVDENLGTLTSGNLSITGTDSRGFAPIAQTINLTTVDYTDLFIDISFYRDTPTSDKMYYKFTGSWWNGNFGNETNTLNLKWRLQGETTWHNLDYSVVGNETTKTLYSGTSVSEETPVEIAHPTTTTWDYQTSYVFEVLVEDELNSYTITKKVTKGEPIYNWYEVNDENYFNVNGKITVKNELVDTAKLARLGKLLWTGNFTTGSITVDGLSNYSLIAVNVEGVYCVGRPYYGGGSFGGYGNLGIATYAYRFTVNGDTLTIDNINMGGTNGTSNIPVTEIYGIF